MTKFQCKYRIIVETDKERLTIEYPLTLKYNIKRNTFASSNTGSFQLYNLAPTTRSAIFQDRYRVYDYKTISFEAGYGDNLTLIFKGKIQQAYSHRSGVDMITEIQAFDIDLQAYAIYDKVKNYSSHTFATGTTFKDAYLTMAADMPNLKVGAIGTLEGAFKMPTVFDDTSFIALNKLTGKHTFIDNGVLHTLMDNEALGDYAVYVIQSDTGLIDTPMRRDAQVEVNIIFEPNIVVGQLVEINSTTSPEFNGQYKVMGISHSGTISDAEAGQRITTLNLFSGAMLPNSNNAITGQTQTEPFSTVINDKVKPAPTKEPSAAREVYYYIKNNKGKIPNTKATRNIWWKELLGNDNTDSERMQELSIGKITNAYYTALDFQNIVDRYFPGKTIKINSGWRSSKNNAKWGGNPKSKHLKGLAIDFRIPGVATQIAYQKIRSVWNGWSGYYKKDDFIHVQKSAGYGIVNDV